MPGCLRKALGARRALRAPGAPACLEEQLWAERPAGCGDAQLLLLAPAIGVNVAVELCGDLGGRPEPLTSAAQPCRSGGEHAQWWLTGPSRPREFLQIPQGPLGSPASSVGFLVCCWKLVIQHSLCLAGVIATVMHDFCS